MIGLSSVCWSFPTVIFSARDYGAKVGLEANAVVEKTGVEERYFLSKEDSAITLAADAFRKLQVKEGLKDRDIDLIVYVTQNPERSMPHSAAQLLSELGFEGKPASFDIALGCSAFPYVLSMTRGMMECQGWSKAVIVTNDPYSRITTLRDSKTSAIFGDGASASLLEKDRGGAIRIGDYGTDGANWGVIHTPCRSDHMRQSNILDLDPVELDASYTMRMNGSKLASYFSSVVPLSVEKCLSVNNVPAKDISIIILHQASRIMLDLLVKKLSFSSDTYIPVQLREGANTGSSSIPIMLGRVLEERSIQGAKVILCGFGVGLSWGSILLEF